VELVDPVEIAGGVGLMPMRLMAGSPDAFSRVPLDQPLGQQDETEDLRPF
jgi:hypothetical protein